MTTALTNPATEEQIRSLVVTADETEMAQHAIAHVAILGPITDNAMALEYRALMEEIHQLETQIENRRSNVKAPVLALSRLIDGAARETLGSCHQAFTILRDKLTAWAAKLDTAKREAERQARLEAQEAGESTPRITAAVMATKEAAAVVKTRKYYRVNIVDEAQIPRDFLMVDEPKILEALKKGAAVPGCELVEERKATR